MINNKKQMFVIIGVFALILLLTSVTYSFFTYTRTGAINNLGTGRIYFNSEQNGALNMTNVFPMTSTEAGNSNLDTVTVGISGDTTYDAGEEFQITIVDVTNTVNGKKVPINYIATYTATTGNSIGNSSDTYWTSRESKNANIYTLNAIGYVKENRQVLVGYIDNEGNGINGTLTIKVYIDESRMAISDTYNGTGNNNMGTTAEWVNGRVVFTTSEWNSLVNNPISFKIRAESNEGLWVEEPIKEIDSCEDCKYIHPTYDDNLFTTWNMHGVDPVTYGSAQITPTVLTTGLYDDYRELVESTGKNFFLGVKLNDDNEITNGYVCGVKNDVPFCIEGTLELFYGGSLYDMIYERNKVVLQQALNNACEVTVYDSGQPYESEDVHCQLSNNGRVYVEAKSYGAVFIGDYDLDEHCLVESDGRMSCGSQLG